MAKQTSLIKINGKADGQSFYTSKNGGALMRSINKGMGQRVKDAKEYINTRKNNAEFGAAGNLAGAIVKPISLRWRFILDSIGTGKLVKAIKAAMVEDTASPWGGRAVPLATMPHLQDVFNSLSKNEMPLEIVTGIQSYLTYAAATETLAISTDITMSADTVQQLLDKGATHFSAKVFALNVSTPHIGPDGKTYVPAESIMLDLSDNFGVAHSATEENANIIDATSAESVPSALNDQTHLGGVLVVFLPERKVGNEYYTLQELCSAYWCPAKAAE